MREFMSITTLDEFGLTKSPPIVTTLYPEFDALNASSWEFTTAIFPNKNSARCLCRNRHKLTHLKNRRNNINEYVSARTA